MTRVPPTPIGKDFNPGGARWCTDHPNVPGGGRLECTKQRSRGRGQCHGPAIRGTDGCRIHSGVSRAIAKTKGEARITAWSAVGQPADGKALDAGMAVLGMLHMTWLRAAAYGELLRRQVALEGGDGPADLTDDDPEGTIKGSGLIGHRFGMGGKDGILYRQSEDVRALVLLESQERDRVVKYAETAHKMGISDRLTSLAERWGDVVITRIMVVLENLELTPEQEAKVPALIQAHLGQIDVGSMGSEKT